MTHHNDPLAHAQHTAHEWLKVVGERLGTEDRTYTYRVLRAWLHLVRDRLTVDSAVHLAAQLPEFLRGVYFEGWVPSRVPIRYDTTGFTTLFAYEGKTIAPRIGPPSMRRSAIVLPPPAALARPSASGRFPAQCRSPRPGAGSARRHAAADRSCPKGRRIGRPFRGGDSRRRAGR